MLDRGAQAAGPGLLESVYESALCAELDGHGIPFERQVHVPLYYRETLISVHRLDLLVRRAVVVEIKSVQAIVPIHVAQMLTYLRVTGNRVGLILNFNTAVMKNGIRRVVL